MVLFNLRPKSIYVHLDQMLFDLKYDPSIIEIPIPRYFKEDDHIKVNLAFTEAVVRSGGKKKGKKSSKKKSKKKKVVEEEHKVAKTFKEKEFMVDNLLEKFHDSAEPEEEVREDPFSIEGWLTS